MLMKAISVTALCLMVTACGSLSMPAGSGTSGSSSGGVTSYENGYGIGNGWSGRQGDSQMDWGE